MSKVHILPPDIVSKIAAGEIIERPASVVKELLENALDAGADTIEVHLKDAGKTLIQIQDNGHGIEHEDLEKIFLRHATSKIGRMADLYAIHSLGFRGEALYSMAAVADITLRSRERRSAFPTDSGWEVHLRGGEKIALRPVTMGRPGTEVEIKELFFNMPARKKFLKSNTTEIHQILNTFIPYTLLHPHCRFRLTHQDKCLLDLAPCDNIVSRVVDALNLDEKHILEADVGTADLRSLHIRLILGDINIKRTRRDMQFILVNDRPVQNKSIAYHLNQIYRLILPPEAFPFFVVTINIPAEDVDVNIHPTKREVKIKNEQELCAVLRSLCEQTLMKMGQIKQVGNAHVRSLQVTGQETIERALPTSEIETLGTARKYTFPSTTATQGIQQFFIPQVGTGRDLSLQKRLEQATYIGSFINKFLLFESNKSLLVIDQHAAAERITYEQLIRQMEKGNLEVQHLLSPILIKLSPQEMLVWEEVKGNLDETGLSCSQWDNETIAIHSYPQLLKDIEKAVRHLLSGESIARCDFETIARRACRASIMAGDRLNREQAEFQREQLLQCLDPFTCPHGRPTVIEMSEKFLDKQFLRT